ncbi:CAP domain-containing protein [Streptomyces sp. NPDC017940]|uniref:CAP domain-containing protein n=1 Tax=Streptomyces sp. NPDC017940 TaxID=3365017 RepID=UPI003788D861
MGRHRRSATGRAAHAATTPPDSHPADSSAGTTGTTGTSGTSYDIVYRAEGPRRAASHRRGHRMAKPVRTGLLGVSAAVAMGAVAVAAGLVPGGGTYSLGGGDEPGAIRSASSPSGLDVQGGGDGSAERGEATPSRGSGRTAAPAPSTSAAEPSAKPSGKVSSAPPKPKPPADSGADESRDVRDEGGAGKKETGKDKDHGRDKGKGGDKDRGGDEARRTPVPEPTRTEKPKPKPPPVTRPPVSGETAAEAEVLTLVNEERAEAGCRPVRADTALADLAGAFSADMATRDFFAHTDPDGATPWDRAEKAGIAGLGGENIARGQVDARSVMAAWMDSPGHRANILNCDYTTMGVGAHFAPGGPWWTQDFGF